MATTTRQTVLFGVDDWKRIYQSYREADFQSYDFETLRKSFVDYLTLYYPETFNDYIESSEFIAMLDVMAFMGQALAFRTDLNTRENYIDTAERRDSVVRLANLVGYTPKRNTEANGYLKVFSVRTTENVTDYNGLNLSNITVNWADPSNYDWQEQFTAIINASLVNTQRVGNPGNTNTILGVKTDEYTISLVPAVLPIVPYTSTVDGVNMPFEVVNSTSAGQDYIYEPSPLPNGQFNILFRNDFLGFSSSNTGYFFYFKQGVLQSQDFNLPEKVPNITVDINIEGVNNTDYWLYQLDNVGNIAGEWTPVQNIYGAAVEQLAPTMRNIYSVTSRTNDQITLVFGDGVFSQVPTGIFRSYVRASNGLQYIINPVDMQSVVIPINYVSRTGQLETITFTCGITEPVTNAQTRESIDSIKQRAPANYYTQNRMVNGEDYTNFPFTTYNSIMKSKALNRVSIGTSRYLELLDPTGKYSSTNIFASDGALYENNSLPPVVFSWYTNNDVYDAISNKINPTLQNAGTKQFYYANFPRPTLLPTQTTWHQSTTLVGETTGYFVNSLNNPVSVGPFTSSNLKYITQGSLIKFVAPPGYYFDANNQLAVGVPYQAGQKTTLWASPTAIYVDGTNQGLGNLPTGQGPVVLDTFVPSKAICVEVIPIFTTDFTQSLIQSISNQIVLGRNFGIGFNNLATDPTKAWYLITSTNLAVDAPFSLDNAQDNTGLNLDASWMIQATIVGNQYVVVTRSLDYYFGSVLETRFFFFTNQKIYDPRTGSVISDFVKVLDTNSQPDNSLPLNENYTLKIIGQPVESDGYVDDFQVLVSFEDFNADGIPDNPDFFTDIVDPTTNPNEKLVFFQGIVDFDNLERYVLVEKGEINSDYPTKSAIELVKDDYVSGMIFYAYDDIPSNTITNQNFYILLTDVNNNKYLVQRYDFAAQVGRQGLYFQYRHNAPLSSRLDPSTSNIIDLYLVTSDYYNAYQNWLKDSTGKIPQPLPPSIDQLMTSYAGLQEYKMISDNMIMNSAEFVPLFGAKASMDLRATIKVIPSQNTVASNNEIKNAVITSMDTYFSIENWDFGATFYFSELTAYLHAELGNLISSVVLVPLNPAKSFGDLYEIGCAPNQIFVNGATVDNVEIIPSLTSTNIQTAPGSGTI
jgi:hypothetical protein